MTLAATGTDETPNTPRGQKRLTGACQNRRRPAEFGGNKNPDSASESGFSSERDGTRTRNHRIDSPGQTSETISKSADSGPRLPGALAETKPSGTCQTRTWKPSLTLGHICLTRCAR